MITSYNLKLRATTCIVKNKGMHNKIKSTTVKYKDMHNKIKSTAQKYNIDIGSA